LTDNELYGYIWQADQIIAQEFGCVQTYAVATSVTAGSAYTIPTGCLYLTDVEWNSVKLKRLIDKRDQNALEFQGYGSTPRSGQPTVYRQWGNSVYLYPVPDQAQTIKYWYCQNAPKITQTSTELASPEYFHVHYADYLLYRMYLKDQDDGRAMNHQQLWNAGIERGFRTWQRRSGEDSFYVVRDEENYRQSEFGII
jgi:hypothetical protein